MTFRLALVGGGPAGMALLRHLIPNPKFAGTQMKVVVYEASSVIGPGLPYANKNNSWLLNLPFKSMGLGGSGPDFAEWMSRKYTGTSDFPPRYWFGQYLQEQATELQEKARQAGIKLEYRTKTEVSDLFQNPYTGEYRVITPGKDEEFEAVALCTGHLSSTTYQHFIGNPHYIHNPWDEASYRAIDPHATIGILGSRLTAIDVAAKLASQQHQGKILMASHSGMLPAVLSKDIPPYHLKHFTLLALYQLTTRSGPLQLSDLKELLWKEFQEAEGPGFNLSRFPRTAADTDPHTWLKNQIDESATAKPWQQVLFALYPLVPIIWPLLARADKSDFMQNYYSTLLTYLAAFPVENAKKMLALMESGQLRVEHGLKEVQALKDKGGFALSTASHHQNKVDVLFNATGPGLDIRLSPLYNTLCKNRLIVPDPLGGVMIDPHHLLAYHPNGFSHHGLFVIGPSTIGACLAALDMKQVSVQAERVTRVISDLTMQRRNKPLPHSDIGPFWSTHPRESKSEVFPTLQAA